MNSDSNFFPSEIQTINPVLWLFNSWQIAVASSVQVAHDLIISSSLLKHKININEQKKVSSFNRGKTSIPFFKFQVHQHYSILLSGWFVRQNDRFKQTTGWSVNYEFTFHNEFTFAIVTFFRRELTSQGFFFLPWTKKKTIIIHYYLTILTFSLTITGFFFFSELGVYIS